MRVFSLALVMSQVVMLREVLQGECQTVFGERQKGFKQRHVNVDIIPNSSVVACRCGGTVNNILNQVVL